LARRGAAAVGPVGAARGGARRGGAAPAGGRGGGARGRHRVLVVVALGGDDDHRRRGDVGGVHVQRRHHLVRGRVTIAVAVLVDADSAPAERAGHRRQRVHRDRPPDDDEVRRGREGLEVDLQRALALARDRDADGARRRGVGQLLGWSEVHEARHPLVEGGERLAHHRRFGAGAADPPIDAPVGVDDRA
jgi:hypothetical protein